MRKPEPRSAPPRNYTEAEIAALLPFLTKREREELDRILALPTIWEPQDGPQRQAYESLADILLYGGAAMGGKSDLLLGLAFKHVRSIIFRREYAQLSALEDRSREILGPYGRYTGGDKKRWLFKFAGTGRMLEFGAMQLDGDERKHMGRPHDYMGFDEATSFLLKQILFVMTWLRTTIPRQRCRVVLASNPPQDVEGRWVIDFFGPWLDPKHPRPAKPGELRWFVTDEKGNSTEVPGPEPVFIKGKKVSPLSRTYVPARVSDNRYAGEAYQAVLDSLEEPLRSIMRDGDFFAAQQDDRWQVIPTAWVQTAQERWQAKTGEERGPLSSLGIDVARSGKDKTVYTARYGNWFAEQATRPGSATPDGQSVIKDALEILGTERAPVQIDTVGIGSSPTDIGAMHGLNVVPLNGANGSIALSKSGNMRFVNKRAEWWWKLREALDPESGEDLALPPDRELLVDLTSARWKMMARGVQIELKDEIKQRIGRSPDKGESLIYAHAQDGFKFNIVSPVVVTAPRNDFGFDHPEASSWPIR